MTRVLDITPLRSLVAIADSGGFRRAAANMALTQSAVSNHVRRLEAAVGQPLVERDGRSTRFTGAGETLLVRARQIVDAHDEALRLVAPPPAVAQLVIGTTEHATDEILPPIISALEHCVPDVRAQFRFDRGQRLRDAVEQGTVDIAVFVSDAASHSDETVGSLPLRWCSAPGWEPPAESRSYPVVAIHAPCSIRSAAMTALAEHGITMNVTAEAAYLAGVINAARAGLGVALMAFAGKPPRGLIERPDLPTAPPITLLMRSRPGTDQRASNAVVEALRATFGTGSDANPMPTLQRPIPA
jgi:DNA-binding transcriptional LysR family regulator